MEDLGLVNWWILTGLGCSHPRGLPPQSLSPAQQQPLFLSRDQTTCSLVTGPGAWKEDGAAMEDPLPPSLHEDTSTGSQEPQAAGLGLESVDSGTLDPHFSSPG